MVLGQYLHGQIRSQWSNFAIFAIFVTSLPLCPQASRVLPFWMSRWASLAISEHAGSLFCLIWWRSDPLEPMSVRYVSDNRIIGSSSQWPVSMLARLQRSISHTISYRFSQFLRQPIQIDSLNMSHKNRSQLPPNFQILQKKNFDLRRHNCHIMTTCFLGRYGAEEMGGSSMVGGST